MVLGNLRSEKYPPVRIAAGKNLRLLSKLSFVTSTTGEQAGPFIIPSPSMAKLAILAPSKEGGGGASEERKDLRMDSIRRFFDHSFLSRMTSQIRIFKFVSRMGRASGSPTCRGAQNTAAGCGVQGHPGRVRFPHRSGGAQMMQPSSLQQQGVVCRDTPAGCESLTAAVVRK